MTGHILVTGGAGFIGSHAVLALLQAGEKVVVLDNFSNSNPEALRRVEHICGHSVETIRGDVQDTDILRRIFDQYPIESVIHFAGLKSVKESSEKPLHYYLNNVVGTVQLCNAMQKAGIFRLVFSSSATVYGDALQNPIKEDSSVGAVQNPYGRSKFIVEGILNDIAYARPEWRIAILRYFNPIGAHESGEIGEDPNGIPNNLLPYVAQVAAGRLPELAVYGADYSTPDGTGVRDYIHVMDLVEGHLKALKYISSHPGVGIWNLGTGQGYSVLQIIKTFERVSGRVVRYQMASRRKGDVAMCWADPEKAIRELGWKAQRGLEQMIADTWRWQMKNPMGYDSARE